MAQEQVGKASFAPIVFRALFAALTRIWTSPFKGSRGAPTYYKDVIYAVMRASLGNMTVAQSQAMNSSTTEVYLQVAKAKGFQPDTTLLPSGVKAHWIGGKGSQKTFVYFHGGGYVMPASPGCIEYLFNLHEILHKTGHSVAIVVLAYTLAPEAVYPKQLAQAMELLQNLVETEKRDPANIALGGDSAGGNLTVSVLSHLVHPHPDSSVPRLELSCPFAAALLISPWVSFTTGQDSYKTNGEKDVFDGKALSYWSGTFLGPSNKNPSDRLNPVGDEYSEPNQAPAEWWKGVEKVVDEVLIWGGGGEVLIDGITQFADKFRQGYGGRCEISVTKDEAHEAPILDMVLGYKTKGEGAQLIEEWVKAKL